MEFEKAESIKGEIYKKMHKGEKKEQAEILVTYYYRVSP